MKKITIILFLVLVLFTGCEKEKEKEEEKKIPTDYIQNETFAFMNYELTFGEEEVLKLNDKEIIKVPVTVKNVGDEASHLSRFYYKFYDSSGTELNTAGSSYNDSLDYAENLKSGENYTKYIYFCKNSKKFYYIELNDTYNRYKVSIEL